jgi:hypothetical protein
VQTPSKKSKTKANLIGLIENRACTAVIGLTLIAFPSSLVNATQQPPRKECVAVSKMEYNSAKREKLLCNRNGSYLRTGPEAGCSNYHDHGLWRCGDEA